jgi:hypothetical protein
VEEEAQALLAESGKVLEDDFVSLEEAPADTQETSSDFLTLAAGSEEILAPEEMASDEEILAAEKELEQHG